VLEDHPRAEAREPARGARERLRIAIDAEEPRVVRALEEPLRVAAEADGAVHHPAAAAWMEEEGDLVGEDGNVGGDGLTRADTGSFSFECARLAFGCASPRDCLVLHSLAPHPFELQPVALHPFALVPFVVHTPLSARRVRRSSSGPACSRW
jgi:hypothetical protein